MLQITRSIAHISMASYNVRPNILNIYKIIYPIPRFKALIHHAQLHLHTKTQGLPNQFRRHRILHLIDFQILEFKPRLMAIYSLDDDTRIGT